MNEGVTAKTKKTKKMKKKKKRKRIQRGCLREMLPFG